MKLWSKILVIGLILLVIFIILGVLYANGSLQNTEWTVLTMIGAAAAGPYVLVRNWLRRLFSSKADSIKESERIYFKLREEEQKKRAALNQIIAEKDKKIESLKDEVNILNIDLKSLQQQRASVKEEVDDLSMNEILAEFDEEY